MVWMEHGLKVSVKSYTLSRKDKMAAEALGVRLQIMSETAPLKEDKKELEIAKG